MDLNLNHLAVFHAVAGAGSVTAAGERLAVSQPAVSKQLKLLERRLGVELFERVGRGMRLTEEGELLASYARRIFGLADEAGRAMEEFHALRRGRLAVATSPTVAAYLLPKLLVRFRQRFPGVEVAVEVGSAEVLRRRVEDRAADFALAEAEITGAAGLDVRKVMEDELVVIVPARHRLARAGRVSLGELGGEQWVAGGTGPVGEGVVEVGAVLRLGSMEAVKEAVAEGLGVAVVPRMTVGEGGRVRVIRVAERLPRRAVYQVRLSDRRVSKAEVAFNCLLKHVARGGLPPLGGRGRRNDE